MHVCASRLIMGILYSEPTINFVRNVYAIVVIHNIGADSYRYYNGAQSLKLRSMRKQLRVSAPADITIREGR